MRTRHEVSEMAHFSPEIDLHIENLSKDYRGLSNGDILKIQLRHFDSFMDKAIRLGVDRIFVIHGLGKGTLKDSIHSRLVSEYRIKTFRNEYHPRYGWGATEVEF
jgi:dsDNA-specific endonuclease/ATPase MutS2